MQARLRATQACSTGCREAGEAGPTAGARAGQPARVQAREAGDLTRAPGAGLLRGVGSRHSCRRMDRALVLLGFTFPGERRQPVSRHAHPQARGGSRLAGLVGGGAALVRWKPQEGSKQRSNLTALSSGEGFRERGPGKGGQAGVGGALNGEWAAGSRTRRNGTD